MDLQGYKEITVDATVKNLTVVNDFVEELLAGTDCSVKTKLKIDLVVEEIFVNIANYAYEASGGKVVVQGCIEENPCRIILRFMDTGIPYDPLQKDPPDLTLPPDKREIGGLGIFLIKENVDELSYHYKDGKNILTITKKI